MTERPTVERDGDQLVIRVPMKFKKRGGRIQSQSFVDDLLHDCQLPGVSGCDRAIADNALHLVKNLGFPFMILGDEIQGPGQRQSDGFIS